MMFLKRYNRLSLSFLLVIAVIAASVTVFAQDVTEEATGEATAESTAAAPVAPLVGGEVAVPQANQDNTVILVIGGVVSLGLVVFAFASTRNTDQGGIFNIVQRRRLFFLLSSAVIVPGILVMGYSLITTGALFQLGIDFEGGSIYRLEFSESGATESSIRAVFAAAGNDSVVIQQIGTADQNRWSVRASFQDEATRSQIFDGLETIAPINRESFFGVEQVSPTLGQEVTQSALYAVLVAAIVITGFIVIAFRQVPNRFRYGLCAIAAMVHDVLVVMGVMSLAGLLLGWEIDALFLTAVLTVVGFSVQDSIVLFDRIRENIPKHLGEPYETIVNRSIWETIHRSLATQLNAFFIMIAILLFGGESVKQFITIFLLGLLSGTYSSIFIAVPLLVAWEKGEIPFLRGSVDEAELTEAV